MPHLSTPTREAPDLEGHERSAKGGGQSIVIYLAFFMFMAATRAVLFKSGLIDDLAIVSRIVTLAGVAGPVLLYLAVRRTPLSFLFIRPK